MPRAPRPTALLQHQIDAVGWACANRQDLISYLSLRVYNEARCSMAHSQRQSSGAIGQTHEERMNFPFFQTRRAKEKTCVNGSGKVDTIRESVYFTPASPDRGATREE